MLAAGDAAAAPPLWAIAPFAALLLSIAILPLLRQTAGWWHYNRNRLLVSAGLGLVTLGYYVLFVGWARVVYVLDHAVLDEYVPFIALLFSLYVISGGIALTGDLPAHPITNTAFLATGTLLASFIGTTGASMLLIRPLLQTNRERRYVSHTVIFFIFLVSNCGGCLLPIGDPPLFLGYLRGVPFLWTFKLWPEWAILNAVLLGLYFAWDCWKYRHEKPIDITHDEVERTPLALVGGWNLLLLLLVVAAVAVIKPGEPLPIVGIRAFSFLRELVMLALVGASLWITPARARLVNQFNYHAILEVAALFIGIFVCMQPALELLHARGADLAAAISNPAGFFWATGALSAMLDNAPTYVVFLETAAALPVHEGTAVIQLASGAHIDDMLLRAVSLGAVFFGAVTYIGNGPNFMVKTIAEQSGVPMPSFFGYLLYSGLILLPLFALLTVLFF